MADLGRVGEEGVGGGRAVAIGERCCAVGRLVKVAPIQLIAERVSEPHARVGEGPREDHIRIAGRRRTVPFSSAQFLPLGLWVRMDCGCPWS